MKPGILLEFQRLLFELVENSPHRMYKAVDVSTAPVLMFHSFEFSPPTPWFAHSLGPPLLPEYIPSGFETRVGRIENSLHRNPQFRREGALLLFSKT